MMQKHLIKAAEFSQLLEQRRLRFRSYFKGDSLYCNGDPLPMDDCFKLAIIGSRRPSNYGLRVVPKLLRRLAPWKPLILSGGALGVDAQAHRSALKLGLATQSWLVGPIDAPSPRSHRLLFQEIVRSPGSSLLVPECLEPKKNEKIQKYYWLVRNAWLVAASDMVVVIEANEKSGTWASVRAANRLSVPVFALPGEIDSCQSTGTNRMISMGYAHPLESIELFTKSFFVPALRKAYTETRGIPNFGVSEGESGDAKENAQNSLESYLMKNPSHISCSELSQLSKKLGYSQEALVAELNQLLESGRLQRVASGFERRVFE